MVIVPVPILFRLKLALFWLPPAKRPEKVKLPVPKPVERVAAAALLVTRPVPVIDLVTRFALLMSSVPAAARATSEKRESPLVAPGRNVPALTVVTPV